MPSLSEVSKYLRRKVGLERSESESAGGRNTKMRGKQINKELCDQGYEEYCPQGQKANGTKRGQ